MKNLMTIIALFIVSFVFSQTKNFIDQPYLETSAEADTLVIPDRIYLKITISENDTKNKKSVEELENIMVQKLKNLGIDTNKQLLMNDLGSSYKKYVLKTTDVMKTKSYDLLVFDGLTAGKVIQELENEDISNIQLLKTQHSQEEKILADLKRRAIIKAKKNANNIANAIGQKVGNAIFIKTLEIPQANNQLMIRGINTLGYSNKTQQEFEPADLNFRKIGFSASLSVTFKLE
ncbi:SIMPL domain-containing protein [Cloacibacterium caeni]|uniref:SIMPL domain-containing protein n=1 Tax=Cloacibacterium caeni TaxID=2004710 RepID=UPI001BCE105A|nr:SIMPL domain-containing protein [Cloacibacterium caeni]